MSDQSHHLFLPSFYASHFPSSQIFSLFKITPKREVSFQLQNQKIIRYLTFSSHLEFKNFILNKLPLKIDFGGNYENLIERNIENNVTWREIVIDIDLTDYLKDENDKKKVKLIENFHFCNLLCDFCLEQIFILKKNLEIILINNLGLKNIIFFFSGNKGFHAYIFDKLNSSNFIRESIINFLKSKNIIADVQVSKDKKHLLKSPFVVHPKTGLVCLPIIDFVEKVHVKDVVEGSVSIERYVKYLEEFIMKRDSADNKV